MSTEHTDLFLAELDSVCLDCIFHWDNFNWFCLSIIRGRSERLISMEKSKSAHTRKALSLALLSTVASAVPTGQAAVQHSGSCIVSRRFSTTEAAESMRPETFELPYAFNIVQKWNSCLLTRTQLHSVLTTLQKVFAYKSTSAFNIAPSPTLQTRKPVTPSPTLQTRKTVTCLGRHQITIQLFASMQLF